MQQTVPHELSDMDRDILQVLAEGRNTPSNLADRVGISRQWALTRLQRMESADYVRNIGRGVYELLAENLPEAERDELGVGTDEPPKPRNGQAALATLRRHLEAAQAAAERGERGELQRRLEQALDELAKNDQ